MFNYVSRTWIAEGSQWQPEQWTAFMQSIRTNNDVEGWHHRINRKVGNRSNLPLYQLIEELHKESKAVDLQTRLVSENKLTKRQRKQTTKLQGRIFKYWDELVAKTRTTEQLLRACAHCYGIAPIITSSASTTEPNHQ